MGPEFTGHYSGVDAVVALEHAHRVVPSVQALVATEVALVIGIVVAGLTFQCFHTCKRKMKTW